MYTKQEAEILDTDDFGKRLLKAPAVAIGFVLAGLRREKEKSEGYCPPVILKTLYKAAGIDMPAELKKSLRKKEQAYPITRAELLELTIEAARNIDDNIADTIIAENRDLPIRKLTTVFPKGSNVLHETRRVAQERIVQEKTVLAALKEAGAIGAKKKLPTLKQAANEYVMQEIFRFASYNGLLQEIDFQRSQATKGNELILCCSNAFVEALKNSRVPGVGQFVPDNPTAPVWPFPVDKPPVTTNVGRHVWPFPPIKND